MTRCDRARPDRIGAGPDGIGASTLGPTYEARLDAARLRTQLAVIREVMLAAAKGGPEGSRWYTLRELAQITDYGEASISAQLRHLRKPQFGGYVVEKRRRRGESLRAGVWEYRVRVREAKAES